MAETVCLDAGVVLKLLLDEPGSEEADRLVDGLLRDGGELIGPAFMLAEALSVLRNRVTRGVIASQDGEGLVERLLSLPIQEVSGPDVYRRAWEIATELGQPVVYDSVYMAVAELRGATFWTADAALYKKAGQWGYLRLVGAG